MIPGIWALPYTFTNICGCGVDYSVVVIDNISDMDGCSATVTGKSPIIQFWPSVKIGKIIEQGRISAFLSFIEDIPNNETVEIYQPLNFVGWWNQVAKTLKKMCVRYHAFDPILKKKLRSVLSVYAQDMNPEAAKLYNRGIKFQDNFNETALQITFHPEKSYKEKQNKN